MKTAIASDHAGLRLKKLITEHFKDIDFADCGTYTEESCDYPDYISKAAFMVRDGQAENAVVICGTGLGASITANKVKGIRAALCLNEFMARKAKEHNNANVLVLGARVTGEDLALAVVESWLSASFEGGRHQRRLDKITAIENGRN